MQRFGTTDIPTHQVGLKILQKDLQGTNFLFSILSSNEFYGLNVFFIMLNLSKVNRAHAGIRPRRFRAPHMG